jgi:hypothetical protein
MLPRLRRESSVAGRQGSELSQELRIVTSTAFSMQTKRLVVAQVVLCRGCCCGAVEKGNPNVPVEWMKDEWKRRRLKKSIQLTISGCLGPCDLSNVASISSAKQTVWLGRLRDFAHYTALLEWALASREAGHALPLPGDLNELRFDPFRREDSVPVAATAEVVESAAGSS